jgi:hypothetical protein
MKNTLENKSKFFAQYFTEDKIIYRKGFVNRPNNSPNNVDAFDLLELKSILKVSNKDAIEVSKIWGSSISSKIIGKSIISRLISPTYQTETKFRNILGVVDYLRSEGYALHWNGITIEQQIEYGWIKLKN